MPIYDTSKKEEEKLLKTAICCNVIIACYNSNKENKDTMVYRCIKDYYNRKKYEIEKDCD